MLIVGSTAAMGVKVGWVCSCFRTRTRALGLVVRAVELGGSSRAWIDGGLSMANVGVAVDGTAVDGTSNVAVAVVRIAVDGVVSGLSVRLDRSLWSDRWLFGLSINGIDVAVAVGSTVVCMSTSGGCAGSSSSTGDN